MVKMKTSSDFSPLTEEKIAESQPCIPWLSTMPGIGAMKVTEIGTYAKDMGDLVEAVRSKRIRATVGQSVYARICQRLEDQGFMEPIKQSRSLADGSIKFNGMVVQPWLQAYSQRTGYFIKDLHDSYLGVRIDFMLERALDDNVSRVAVVTRHSGRGRAVIDAIGSLSVVLFAGACDRGLALIAKDGWKNQFAVNDGDKFGNVQVYFIQ